MFAITLDRDKLDELCSKNTKTLTEMALKLAEETGEIAQAVLSVEKAQGSAYKAKDVADVIEELVDATMVIESMLHRLKVTDSEFNAVFNQKLKKWEEKTK
ncbi:MazG-like pyrophosphatase [Bacillus phage NotTheCreek]|uniref:Nucleotide pyrophosphohydrolase n=3 Tax=Wphvirus TaxID=1922327 RepID=A0A222Z289_9CAUD|nr:MazG-like pyrophosphatase [Bacillus phage Hakuna]YP_009279375.1 MazG-like pyrophosphatase [Bacillus phage Kida]YP_009281007.1 MazG-like pyrophosphatase [Bacillus phage SageFayge]YP_009284532.1 MazG-like pyrophosphatase [Bacillus phage NotTheCreek]ASR78273.1 nucleotide pyrophosphohydrolase [Bacillus phage PPIsBest]QDH49479.1 nucleoside triphosphate pyrophosphohydrolase [Bacillus phage Phireball]QDH50187.1 nucleoside triphosphate pyrophosphohydrolase [Bacillus phage ALPS]AHZ10218.1 hydrolas